MSAALRRSGAVTEVAGLPCQSCSHPPPHKALHSLSLSQPRKTWSPRAVAFKHCHSSHSIPIVVPARHVMMTQPELYLEAWGMALCSSPSQSDRRFPEHLGLGFPPEDEGQKDFPNGLFPSHEGPHLLEALLRDSISVNATISPCCKIQPFYKACKTCYRKERIVGKSVRK